MKKHRTESIEIAITQGKDRSLYLVPMDKAHSIQNLLEEYRAEDFIPADEVLKELYGKYGKVGVVLRGLRAREGLTQEELARQLRCPQSWISGWENGSRPLGKQMAKKIAKLFKTDYRVFL